MLTVAEAMLVIAAAVTGAALIVRAALAARRSGAAVGAGPLPSRTAGSGPPDPRRPSVVGWRFARLLRAGCDAQLALRLAERPDTDVHVVLALIRRGCPAPLAARITEPCRAVPRRGDTATRE